MNHSDYMRFALKLAKKGTGKVSPNPRVGCVVVKNGRIVSTGFHAFFGGPHAEQMALASLPLEISAGACCYVTLEPCNHTGKTPPCTEALIRAGIRKVFIGCPDPNPQVDGKGIRRLREAGIDVECGLLETECRRLNEAFAKYIRVRLPFVTLKIAQTLDGRIADHRGGSRWISGVESRRAVHRLRMENDAVIVGIGTVLSDDPRLTVRSLDGAVRKGLRLRRVVMDSRLRCPVTAAVIGQPDHGNTVLAATSAASVFRRRRLERLGATVWILRSDSRGRVSVPDLLVKMADEGMASVLVEGGASVFGAFLDSGLVDRVTSFVAPALLGGGMDAFRRSGKSAKPRSFEPRWSRTGSDCVVQGGF
jgi:diaminohydroxyphosphoribosylaminopyrimidine deaminase / 5-amino-6-(5-phosphoribosylamino)uracil reductase